MVLTITDNASLQIKEMMKEEDQKNVRLRFGIKGGGCSGLSYSMGFDYDVNEELDTTDEINEIPLVLNKQDIPIIEGTTIDFKQNMMGGGFTIDNPNAIVSCGCGSSFKAKEREGTPENC
ncbi:iron-sulfur cluster assembly accessory protein [Aquibacillus sp. 3ASR75-11]|uniref:Iron-sulfur cluster assembly accessory protein n=1 Tax=Terrihalobacillus insolitus TaxID=2950438 RepID=A0A9X4AKC2_9BACI|nr:iron-sulfur cluster assembly accessory protein [Terrihalobacillus insolitus]MDC3412371.1 iron-sulfur cluster assembly accessory protein [Terrihalobacillus insolitus]MDC3422936.1 iron-sulfur cluster assembly accessory protein [Terrihalobacillus insolitus]